MSVSFGSTATAASTSGPTLTWSLTTVASDTRLIVLVGKASGGVAPTSVTYNGVGLTADGNAPSAGFNLSVWHLDNPPAGPFNVIVNLPSQPVVAIAIPLTGADLAPAPSLGTATTGSSAAASCT